MPIRLQRGVEATWLRKRRRSAQIVCRVKWRDLLKTQVFALAMLVTAVSPNHMLAATTPISNNVVKIGVLTDLSGPYSEIGGQGSVLAAHMAVDEFRKSASPSFDIQIISADHQNKPDIGASKAREWYDTQQVDVIVDVINSAVALAVSKVTAEKERLLLASGAGTTRLTNEECSPNTISYTWDTYSLSRPQVVAITTAGRETWFFVTVDYALGQSVEQEATSAIKANGGKIVGSVKHPLNSPDFSSFMLQAQASKASAVAIANGGNDLVNAVRSAREFGITKSQTIVPLTATITDVHAMGLELAQGLLLTEAFYWNQNARTREWSRQFFSVRKRMPNAIHAGTYSAVLTYLNAVQRAGTDAATAIVTEMKRTPINDVFATNGRIREDGRMVKEMYLMEVKKPAESVEPWDYYKVKAVVDASVAFQPLSESRCSLVKRAVTQTK